MGFLSTVGGALASGGLGYLGVKETNRANQRIASARNVMEVEEAQKAREFSANEAGINRKFQERMSNTAVSRRMKDMKEAGINPILAGKYDASTPAGNIGATAKANAHGYEAANKMQGFLSNASAVLDLKRKSAEIDNLKATTGLTGNKDDITKALAMVMSTIASFIEKPTNSAKNADMPSLLKQWSNQEKDSLSNAAKIVNTKKDQVMHTYGTWWEVLKREMSNIFSANRSKERKLKLQNKRSNK